MKDMIARIPGATATVFEDDEDGTVVRFRFANGFGASVSRTRLSYGSEDGLFELAVLDAAGHFAYDIPITSDVLPGLTVEEVIETLHKIAEL